MKVLYPKSGNYGQTKGTWSFTVAGQKGLIKAKISDKNFLARYSNGNIRFHQADRLKVLLHEKQIIEGELTPVIFTPAANDDVTRAAQWYEARREGFGTRLLEKVDEAVRKIALNPLGCVPMIDDVRRCVLRRFPLALWFPDTRSGEKTSSDLGTATRSTR